MKIIDARGLSCPEPVIMLRQAMMSKESAYQIIVDSYAEHQGYKTTVTEKDGEYTLTFQK